MPVLAVISLSPKYATLKHQALVGIRCDRKLEDGRSVAQLHLRGQQLRLSGLKFPVHVSWYYFKRSDGKSEKRYVICTKALKASTITLVGSSSLAEAKVFSKLPNIASV